MSSSDDEYDSEMDDDSMVEESPISLANLENINDIETLEKLTSEKINTIFDPDCVRKRSNWSKSSNTYKFDTEQFNPKILLEDIPSHSPKLDALLSKIEKLDANDMQQHGKLFKHFIFSDLKSGSFGSKLVAGALIAKGFTLGYTAKNKSISSSSLKPVIIPPAPANSMASMPPVPPNSMASIESFPPAPANSMASMPPAPPNSMASMPPAPPNSVESMPPAPPNSVESMPPAPPNSMASIESLPSLEESMEEEEDTVNESTGGAKSKTYGKIELLTDAELAKTPNKNFYLLCSVSVYEQNITVKQKKAILQKMNQRPENVNGELARIIVMDSGFKEGIDLFDIKYVHIFEPQVTTADQKQVIGRATRTCGQKGLDFHPMRGWPLHVYIYDIDIPQNLREYMLNAPSAFNLYMKALNLDVRLIEFTHDLERLSIYGSVDYELNKNIHDFSVSGNSSEVGGAAKSSSRRLIVRNDLPILHLPRELSQLSFNQDTNSHPTFQEMREYIKTNFSQFTWEKAKMENLCGKGGASHALRYTPTQDFIRHYFTPTAPVKGMLLFQSVGCGKTCSAIAAATSTFEKQGYTILWVTRTTLKNDIWKNMFDQVCNEQIREELEKGLIMPTEQNKRMRLLSQSWSIRPMSYKQFSNLVSKQNNFYKALVKKNGEADPLRKTLLIIDEAHKLYGGGDLSTIERPDMNALKRSIEHSYQLSGINSVRLLLMTATPITENPMELIKLLNLCKPSQDQMPELFDDFSKEYLDDYGRFTRAGEANYLDKIAGHISFLNREKDARQFSQPIVKFVTPSLITDLSMAKRYDKKYVRQYLNSDVNKLKEDIIEKTNTIDKELQDLDASRFDALHDVCNSYEGKMQKECKKVVRANIRDLLKEAKAEVQQVRDSIKSIREEIKNKNLFKTESLAKIKENLENNPEEYKRFKDTMYYQLKEKCGKVVKTADDLKEAIKEHPIIVELNEQLREQDIKIEELKEKLKNDLILYKKRIQQIKEIMKMELSQLEKNVLRIVLRDERKTQRKNNRLAEKEMTERMNEFNKTKRNIEKKKRKKTGKIRKTLREVLNEEKAMERETKRAEKKLKKTLRKEGKLRENIENEMLQELFTKYSKIINDELIDLKEMIENDNAAKLEKENAKKAVKVEKENTKKAVKVERENAKVEKQKEKVRLANEKAYLREREKMAKKLAKETKKAERLANKNSRKTKKISQS
jgi:hypothetical protein